MQTKILSSLTLVLLIPIFSLASQTTSEVEKWFQGIQEPQVAVIELLEEGESYSIEITSIGCFNGTRQTVVVTRNSDVYTANFQDQIKILSDQDIQAFVNFETKLRSLKMGGCSTVDTYVLRYKNQEFRTSDGSCNWFGGSKLLKIFT